MTDLSVLKCPKPDELVHRYLQGSSIESLTKDVYRSRLFVRKQKAREYVYRAIYDYNMKQKKDRDWTLAVWGEGCKKIEDVSLNKYLAKLRELEKRS